MDATLAIVSSPGSAMAFMGTVGLSPATALNLAGGHQYPNGMLLGEGPGCSACCYPVVRVLPACDNLASHPPAAPLFPLLLTPGEVLKALRQPAPSPLPKTMLLGVPASPWWHQAPSPRKHPSSLSLYTSPGGFPLHGAPHHWLHCLQGCSQGANPPGQHLQWALRYSRDAIHLLAAY